MGALCSWHIDGIQKHLGEGPKKPIPLPCPPDCFFPALALLLKTQAIAWVQSPGQMSFSSSTQSRSCCRARDMPSIPTFSLSHLQCADGPCFIVRLFAASSQWPFLPAENRTQEGASCPDGTSHSKKLSFSKTKHQKWGSYSPVLFPLTSFYQ